MRIVPSDSGRYLQPGLVCGQGSRILGLELVEGLRISVWSLELATQRCGLCVIGEQECKSENPEDLASLDSGVFVDSGFLLFSSSCLSHFKIPSIHFPNAKAILISLKYCKHCFQRTWSLKRSRGRRLTLRDRHYMQFHVSYRLNSQYPPE